MNLRAALGTLTLTLALVACGTTPQAPQSDSADSARTNPNLSVYQAPLLGTDKAEAIPGQYIVVLNDGTLDKTISAQNAGGLLNALNLDPAGVTMKYMYGTALNGFAAKLSAQNLQTLRADPRVKYIEQDGMMWASATQSGATWGIDRSDQRNLPLNSTYTYDTTASNVTAYIIDTGIRTSHSEFGGRAVWGTNTMGDGNNTDCHGHGTHVGGTVGGKTYGLAKGVKLVAVKVLGCNGGGSNSSVLAGVNWAASNKSGPAVANMSLGGGASTATDDAVKGAIAKGLVMVVAAGNETQNACNVSPARVGAAITVGSTTSTDARSSFSNYGTCVDIFAPGSNITSAIHTNDTGTKAMSGTSMAAPHVAGAAALILAANPTYTNAQVDSVLKANATPGKVTDAKTGSPNLLLYTAPGSSTTPTPDPTPTPTPTPGNETFTGTISTSGSYNFHPGSTGFTYAGGTIKGSLSHATGRDFDLYLQKKNADGTWTYVIKAATAANPETGSYVASAGTYRWIVNSYSGTGSYTLTVTK